MGQILILLGGGLDADQCPEGPKETLIYSRRQVAA